MQIAFMLTDKCNALCSHCITSSSPDTGSLLSTEYICRVIDDAAQLSKNQKRFSICFTGGEPFLYFDRLVEVVNYGHQKKAIISCVTNGFWAVSDKATKEKIAVLKNAGLSSIGLSFDLFHGKFISVNNIKRILKFSKNFGIRIAFKNTVLKGSLRAGDILKKFEDIIIDTSISIDEARCLPLGRAKHISSDKFLYNRNVFQEKCNGVGDITIDAKGNVYPCCIPDWPEILCLGNIYQNSFSELITKIRNNYLFNILIQKGPAYFLPFLLKEGYDFTQKKFVNKCHLCNEVLKLCEKDKSAGKVLEEVLEKWRKIKEKEKEVANIILSWYE